MPVNDFSQLQHILPSALTGVAALCILRWQPTLDIFSTASILIGLAVVIPALLRRVTPMLFPKPRTRPVRRISMTGKRTRTDSEGSQDTENRTSAVYRHVCDIEDIGLAKKPELCYDDYVSKAEETMTVDGSVSAPERKGVTGMVSVLQLFKIGIGPSSSHTVGPMKAANLFAKLVLNKFGQQPEPLKYIKVDLFGSLALTGIGHGTDTAIVVGLLGNEPETVDPMLVEPKVKEVVDSGRLNIMGSIDVEFVMSRDILFRKTETLPFHTNALTLSALDDHERIILRKTFYSVGGGFIVDDDLLPSHPELGDDTASSADESEAVIKVPYDFRSSAELLDIGRRTGLSIPQIVMENEKAWRPEKETKDAILNIWSVMKECIEKGLHSTSEVLPGNLKVKRRAPRLYRELTDIYGYETKKFNPKAMDLQGTKYMKWLSVFALAVNEENAAGGRVVTAPTNGAAGIIPAVLRYYTKHHAHSEDDIVNFMLTATAIGYLFKTNASISGAESGCQGEVGTASAMAAGALAAVLGGTNEQIENAAEIAMEHHLGMTCDPVGGLVQVPCIERNTMGALKAVNAAVLALHGEGVHVVSLDSVIRVMKRTGDDMQSKYKETSTGGLALEFETFRESVRQPVC